MDSFDKPRAEKKPNSERTAELRAEIVKAEREENEARVLELEAELRAIEMGKEFNKATYFRSLFKPKTQILREMQSLNDVSNPLVTDTWNWDGLHASEGEKSYTTAFKVELSKFGFNSFPELVTDRAHSLERPLKVLDLFGGAYFLKDLTDVSTIIGVRFADVDPILSERYARAQQYDRVEEIKTLIEDPRRTLIEGNLYTGSTWRTISKAAENGAPYFDLITCRPEGPFGYSEAEKTSLHVRQGVHDIVEQSGTTREEIFVVLLERTLKLLSPEGGMFFAQMPILNTKWSIAHSFWDEYLKKKQKEGYFFSFSTGDPFTSKTFMVQRRVLDV